MAPQRDSRTTMRAFTLIELLVVISIIVLLIAILLPVLSKAREAAQGSACLSNQRQVGIAMAGYQVDSNGYFPPMYPGWDAGNYSEDDNFDWSRMLLARKYVAGYGAYLCPSNEHLVNARRIVTVDYLFSYKHVSYGYNRLHIGTSVRYNTAGPVPDPEFSPPARDDQVKSPGKTILTADAWNRKPPLNEVANNETIHFFLDKSTDTFQINGTMHGGAVMLWADGHATRQSAEWLADEIYDPAYDAAGGSPLLRRFPR